jgi:hypothetical protein
MGKINNCGIVQRQQPSAIAVDKPSTRGPARCATHPGQAHCANEAASSHVGLPTRRLHWVAVRRAAAIGSAVSVLAACGTPAPQGLGAQGLPRLKDKSLAIVNTVSAPDFTAFTPGKAAFSLLGDVAMRKEGNEIVGQNAVADPAVAIARDLAQMLNNSVGTRWTPGSAPIVSNEGSASALSSRAAGANLLLMVRTTDWRIWYYTTNFNRYRARVEVVAELIDTTSQTVLAKASCDESSPQSADASPTYSEMLADGAKRLKDELARAQSACVATLNKGLLGS